MATLTLCDLPDLAVQRFFEMGVWPFVFCRTCRALRGQALRVRPRGALLARPVLLTEEPALLGFVLERCPRKDRYFVRDVELAGVYERDDWACLARLLRNCFGLVNCNAVDALVANAPMCLAFIMEHGLGREAPQSRRSPGFGQPISSIEDAGAQLLAAMLPPRVVSDGTVAHSRCCLSILAHFVPLSPRAVLFSAACGLGQFEYFARTYAEIYKTEAPELGILGALAAISQDRREVLARMRESLSNRAIARQLLSLAYQHGAADCVAYLEELLPTGEGHTARPGPLLAVLLICSACEGASVDLVRRALGRYAAAATGAPVEARFGCGVASVLSHALEPSRKEDDNWPGNFASAGFFRSGSFRCPACCAASAGPFIRRPWFPIWFPGRGVELGAFPRRSDSETLIENRPRDDARLGEIAELLLDAGVLSLDVVERWLRMGFCCQEQHLRRCLAREQFRTPEICRLLVSRGFAEVACELGCLCKGIAPARVAKHAGCVARLLRRGVVPSPRVLLDLVVRDDVASLRAALEAGCRLPPDAGVAAARAHAFLCLRLVKAAQSGATPPTAGELWPLDAIAGLPPAK